MSIRRKKIEIVQGHVATIDLDFDCQYSAIAQFCGKIIHDRVFTHKPSIHDIELFEIEVQQKLNEYLEYESKTFDDTLIKMGYQKV